MNEFIEKLIGRLEELKKRNTGCYGIACIKCKYDNECHEGEKDYKVVLDESIKIVNQLAEEYNNESVKTNADYIRNMTNDELTTFLSSIDHITDEGDRLVVFEGEAMHDNIVDIEIWLKEEREPKGE